MLDASTLYLLLAMALFLCIAGVLTHYHNNADQVRRKKSEVEAYTVQLNKKIAIVENEVVDLKLQVDELNDQIEEFKAG